MIECPKCKAITITRTPYAVYVCHGCGNKWNENGYNMENDNVNHPKHYQNGLTVEVECIMFSRHLGFALGNAFKYVWRAGMKDDIKQDIQKALWYLDDANEFGVKVCKTELIDFLPKFDKLNWKYNILRYILHGDIEMAQSLLHSKLKHLNTAS